MTDLSPEARALLKAADQDDPSPQDRERVKRALMASVMALPPPPSGLSKGLLAKWGGVVALGAAVGGGWWWTQPAPVVPATEIVVTAPEIVAEPPRVEVEVAPEKVAQEPEKVAPRRPRPAPAQDLAAEAKLLSVAQRALEEGRPAAALGPLAEHAQRFPNGLLKEERLAARALAYCRAGRPVELAAARSALLQFAPQSVHLARLEAECPAPR